MLLFSFILTEILILTYSYLVITKNQLIAALNVAKDAQIRIDAALAAKAAAEISLAEANTKNTSLEVSLAAISAERDAFKINSDIITDSEVVDLVNSIVPPEPVV